MSENYKIEATLKDGHVVKTTGNYLIAEGSVRLVSLADGHVIFPLEDLALLIAEPVDV